MAQLLISWVCDNCMIEAAKPSPVSEFPAGGDLWVVGGSIEPRRGYSTGFASLDAITGGYPAQEITELFGDDETLERCWHKLPSGVELDLDCPEGSMMESLHEMLAIHPMVAVRVSGGDGARYAKMATVLSCLVANSSSGVVLFNPSVRTNPLCSVAPRVVKYLAGLRIRLMCGIAEVVKNRSGEQSLHCKL